VNAKKKTEIQFDDNARQCTAMFCSALLQKAVYTVKVLLKMGEIIARNM
jgi:hypothetical protein